MIQPKILVPDCDPDELAYINRRIDEVREEIRKLVEKRDVLTARRTARPIQLGDRF
jgi:hypothetical protein